jgi:hypothetical protein
MRFEKPIHFATYSACSSTMLVVNKLALRDFPFPAALWCDLTLLFVWDTRTHELEYFSFLQVFLAVAIVGFAEFVGVTTFEAISSSKAKAFGVLAIVFGFSILSNANMLSTTSVGAVVAARCCLPIPVAIFEWILGSRMLPTLRYVLRHLLSMP